MMHPDLIEPARAEVLRLITKQNKLLSDLLEIPNIFLESDENGEHKTNSDIVKSWRSRLTIEAEKVDKLEMVVTVVGSMKAGKSTTINAIVGLELLPSSNKAMTSSPTLIRHRVNQIQPVLTFPRHEMIENMVEEIKQKLIDLKNRNDLNSVELYNDQDGERLIQDIIDGNIRNFQKEYKGENDILKTLRVFNELIRLSLDKNIKVEPIINGYEKINHLPTIEVKFLHLPEKNEITEGTLTLLDTPGPNEYFIGQSLRKVLKTQIANTSALLAILHYGQMKSDGEAQMRQELENQIQQIIEDTFFIFVNRFDDKDRNGMDAEAVKHYAAESFMKRKVKQEYVYPVSATHAFLSNRALYYTNKNENLPDYRDEENKWVEDFAKAVFGVFWEKKIQDQNEIKSGAEQLWDLSGFEKAINEVVVKAANTAARVSMKFATDKMIEYVNLLHDFLEIRRGGLNQNIEDIHKAINDLQQDIQNVAQAETTANEVLQHLTKKFLSDAKAIYKEVEQKLKTILENSKSFTDEKEKQKKQLDQQQKENQNILQELRKKRIITESFIKEFKSKYETYLDSSPEDSRLKFSSEEEAKFFLNLVKRSVIEITDESVKDLRARLLKLSKQLEQNISETLKEKVEGILTNARERLKSEGFLLTFDLPEPEIEQNDIDLVELFASDIEKSTKHLVSPESIEIKAWWAGIARFFGNLFVQGWGYEAYIKDTDTKVYNVDMKTIIDEVSNNLYLRIKDTGEKNNDFMDEIIKPISDKYFTVLKDYLERLRGDLRDSIKIQQLDQQDKRNLLQRIYDLGEETELHTQDLKLLRGGLESK